MYNVFTIIQVIEIFLPASTTNRSSQYYLLGCRGTCFLYLQNCRNQYQQPQKLLLLVAGIPLKIVCLSGLLSHLTPTTIVS